MLTYSHSKQQTLIELNGGSPTHPANGPFTANQFFSEYQQILHHIES